MHSVPHILVADVQQGQARARQALIGCSVEVVCVDTLADAIERLQNDRDRFDLVICGMHFDNSRMFDLLQFIRTHDDLDNVSFVVIREVPPQLSGTVAAVEQCAPALGACEIVETGAMTEDEANQALRDAVEKCLNKPVKELRKDNIA
jgi:CheY-like chemotaxis protein